MVKLLLATRIALLGAVPLVVAKYGDDTSKSLRGGGQQPEVSVRYCLDSSVVAFRHPLDVGLIDFGMLPVRRTHGDAAPFPTGQPTEGSERVYTRG